MTIHRMACIYPLNLTSTDRAALPHGDRIDLRTEDLLTRPQFLYVTVPAVTSSADSRMVAKLLVKSLHAAAEFVRPAEAAAGYALRQEALRAGRPVPDDLVNPVFVLCDEAAGLASPELATVCEQARSRGLSLGFFLQNRQQLVQGERDYSATFLDVGLKLFLRFEDSELWDTIQRGGGEVETYSASWPVAIDGHALDNPQAAFRMRNAVARGLWETPLANVTVTRQPRLDDNLIAAVCNDPTAMFLKVVDHAGSFTRYGGFYSVLRGTYLLDLEDHLRFGVTAWPEPSPGEVVVPRETPFHRWFRANGVRFPNFQPADAAAQARPLTAADRALQERLRRAQERPGRGGFPRP